MVKKTIQWCEREFGTLSTRCRFEVKYYKSAKYHGYYQSAGRKITVFVEDSMPLKQVVDTIIHEYTHYMQMKSGWSERWYAIYDFIFGYWNNPKEVQARAMGARYRRKCLKHLIHNEGILEGDY